MKRLALSCVFVATVALFGGVTPAQTAPITYTFTTAGSGVLNAAAFTNQLVTFTLTGDTDFVVTGISDSGGTCAVCQANAVTGTIQVESVTDTIAEPIALLLLPFSGEPEFNLLAGVALFEVEHGIGMAGTLSNAFIGASLATSLGPVSAQGVGSTKAGTYGEGELTTGGGTFYWTTSPETSTYTAVTSTPVPEPTSLMLLGTGVIALAGGRRFRRRGSNRG